MICDKDYCPLCLLKPFSASVTTIDENKSVNRVIIHIYIKKEIRINVCSLIC